MTIALSNSISDNRPISLKEMISDYGPRLFRFFNSWMQEDLFDGVLKNSWAKATGVGDHIAAVRFKNKLKRLKDDLRGWWKETKQRRDVQKSEWESRLQEIDVVLDQGGVIEVLLAEPISLRHQLMKVEKIEMLDMAQKAKVKWSAEGDEKSKFFHGVLKRKRQIGAIKGVKVDGEWLTDVDVVKDTFFSFFKRQVQAFRYCCGCAPTCSFSQTIAVAE